MRLLKSAQQDAPADLRETFALAQSLVLASTQLGERVHLHWPCLYKHAIRRHSTRCRLFGAAAQHALQDVSSKHYDRYDYLPEKRQAMQT